jgi:hypothetical protein
MSREERYGTRDLAFSRWHRSLERDDLTWIDLDHFAYCDQCKDPLYLFELAQDVGQEWKATTITRRAAERLGVPALLVLYTVRESAIVEFRVRRIAPTWGDWQRVAPAVLAEWIERQHDRHVCAASVSRSAA